MATHVQTKVEGIGTWELVPAAEAEQHGNNYRVRIPVESELAARLTGAGLKRRHMIVADREPFVIPNVWHGIVRAWWHDFQHVVIEARPATPAELGNA